MTHVSRRRMPDETRDILENALLYIFSNLKPSQTNKILSTLLTRTEKTMLAKRLGITYLLQESLDDNKIADIVKTTRQTVARIRLQLLAGSKEERDYLLLKLSKWGKIKKLKELAKDVAISIAKRILRASVGRP